jgi:homoserine kinase type II
MSNQQLTESSRLPASLASAYPLERPRILSQFESYRAENYLIEDARGSMYVLRRLPRKTDPERLAFLLELQRHLRAHGLPVASHIETTDRRSFSVDGDDNGWILYRYVDGNEYDFSRALQAKNAGRCLARFHLATESFTQNGPGPEHKRSIRTCWANAREDVRGLRALLQAPRCNDHLDRLSDWWDVVLDEWPLYRFDLLPTGWLHGDYHGRNLVFDGDRIVGMFDFDDVDRGPYAYDVASGIFKFGREGRGPLLTMRPAFAGAFLDGYASLRPLSAEEHAALNVLIPMGYPPNPHFYQYMRDERGESIEQPLIDDVSAIEALNSQLKGLS